MTKPKHIRQQSKLCLSLKFQLLSDTCHITHQKYHEKKTKSNKNMNKLSFKRTCSFGCLIMASTSVGIPELSARACITIIWNWVQIISYKSRKVLTLWASKYGGNNFLLILYVYIWNGSNASHCFFLSLYENGIVLILYIRVDSI